MVISGGETKERVVNNLFGGEGSAVFRDIAGKDETFGHARLFSIVTLEPGCSVGYHVHTGEGEIYRVLRGRALFNDNGTEREIGPGDVTITGDGQGHAISNIGKETLEYVALITLA